MSKELIQELAEACTEALNIRHYAANERARQSVGQTMEALKWTDRINAIETKIKDALAKVDSKIKP